MHLKHNHTPFCVSLVIRALLCPTLTKEQGDDGGESSFSSLSSSPTHWVYPLSPNPSSLISISFSFDSSSHLSCHFSSSFLFLLPVHFFFFCSLSHYLSLFPSPFSLFFFSPFSPLLLSLPLSAFSVVLSSTYFFPLRLHFPSEHLSPLSPSSSSSSVIYPS